MLRQKASPDKVTAYLSRRFCFLDMMHDLCILLTSPFDQSFSPSGFVILHECVHELAYCGPPECATKLAQILLHSTTVSDTAARSSKKAKLSEHQVPETNRLALNMTAHFADDDKVVASTVDLLKWMLNSELDSTGQTFEIAVISLSLISMLVHIRNSHHILSLFEIVSTSLQHHPLTGDMQHLLEQSFKLIFINIVPSASPAFIEKFTRLFGAFFNVDRVELGDAIIDHFVSVVRSWSSGKVGHADAASVILNMLRSTAVVLSLAQAESTRLNCLSLLASLEQLSGKAVPNAVQDLEHVALHNSERS
jgi:hypothetical protein